MSYGQRRGLSVSPTLALDRKCSDDGTRRTAAVALRAVRAFVGVLTGLGVVGILSIGIFALGLALLLLSPWPFFMPGVCCG